MLPHFLAVCIFHSVSVTFYLGFSMTLALSLDIGFKHTLLIDHFSKQNFILNFQHFLEVNIDIRGLLS